MKTRLCGYFRANTNQEKALGKFALRTAKELIDDPRIKFIQLTFHKHPANWNYGFSRLVKGNRINIVVAYGYKRYYKSKLLILHELLHARQILEGRLNKDLSKVRFTNRQGRTRHYLGSYTKDDKYMAYKCRENQRRYAGKGSPLEAPWEVEVWRDTEKLIKVMGIKRGRKLKEKKNDY